MKRSNKPLIWGLFAGGGTLAAFLAPAMIFATGVAVPLGLVAPDAFAYERMQGLVRNPLAALVLFGVLTMMLWHAAHRLRITAHDFGIRSDRLVMRACYGLAAFGTICLATTLIVI